MRLVETSSHTDSDIPKGDDHSVLLVQGLFESPYHMHEVAERLEARGHHPEFAIKGTNLGGYHEFAEVARKANEIILKEGEAHIVGHSWGGWAGVALSNWNNRVNIVVALGSPICNLPISPNSKVLSVSGVFDLIVPFPFSLAHGASAQNVFVPTDHLGLLKSQKAFAEEGRFLAAA